MISLWLLNRSHCFYAGIRTAASDPSKMQTRCSNSCAGLPMAFLPRKRKSSLPLFQIFWPQHTPFYLIYLDLLQDLKCTSNFPHRSLPLFLSLPKDIVGTGSHTCLSSKAIQMYSVQEALSNYLYKMCNFILSFFFMTSIAILHTGPFVFFLASLPLLKYMLQKLCTSLFCPKFHPRTVLTT